ncbi:4'-phosphopantetheinyl transferase [Streptomyces sulfonofaciens]|uniref:4'-phosphopantetheinyl transferase n=1 Tax=Streptomyces sulfonofaciens TaxID=68272 RepID=A0A919GI65_9ACTN|nr:4'-phosphopantetheinyl transferase superfamily protein [Streptomyces sulfonofaciens]GHH84861.1 4'-phosphopantetheinyl transferase [Streptomyces sulfonofaciens]
MIEEILPEGKVAAEAAFSDFPAEPGLGLFPEEAALVARAVPQRRLEFATVRLCARRALGRLGVPPAPLLWGRRGAPAWPHGIVGSLTHCAGFRAAAVARGEDVASLGIDAEPDKPLPDGVLDAIALRREVIRLRELNDCHPGVCWDRLLFSAKESVYKTWFPLTGRELDFDEAEIRIDPTPDTVSEDSPLGSCTGGFTARLLVPPPTVGGQELTSFSGRWLVRRGLVVTGIALVRVPTAASSPLREVPLPGDVVRA